MVEDKLNPGQRIRLESLSQANMMVCAYKKPHIGDLEDVVLNVAKRFEHYIIEGEINGSRR